MKPLSRKTHIKFFLLLSLFVYLLITYKPLIMNTFFVTTEEAETKLSKDLLPHTTHCECGQSSGYIDEKNNCKIVVCNSCHDNASNRERFF